jgi:hypothetical protein
MAGRFRPALEKLWVITPEWPVPYENDVRLFPVIKAARILLIGCDAVVIVGRLIVFARARTYRLGKPHVRINLAAGHVIGRRRSRAPVALGTLSSSMLLVFVSPSDGLQAIVEAHSSTACSHVSEGNGRSMIPMHEAPPAPGS